MRPLALAALLIAAPARAAAPAGLIACFDALEGPDEDGKPLTEGAGQNIGRWEWAPPKHYAAIAVASRRAGRDGFYFYGEDSAEWIHFATPRIPPHMTSGAYWVVPLELRPKGEGRGYFHCTYRWTPDIKGARPALDCDVTGREPKYHAPVVVPLKGADADWSPLRTAVLERIMSAHALFARRAARHGEALARWRKRNSDPKPGWASVADMAGVQTDWYFAKPAEPSRGAAQKALGVCAGLDGDLGAAARTEAKLLENAILPR
jgi:hypothetical protein